MYEIRTAAIGSGFGLQLNDTCFCGSVQDLLADREYRSRPVAAAFTGLAGPCCQLAAERSGASQAALTTGASTVGCAPRAAKEIGEHMTENIITTKRGVYGRVNVTLPLPIKLTMLAWAKRSGMKKAEFLRTALTTGFLALSNGIPAGEREEAQGRAPGREEDARSAPSPHRGLS